MAAFVLGTTLVAVAETPPNAEAKQGTSESSTTGMGNEASQPDSQKAIAGQPGFRISPTPMIRQWQAMIAHVHALPQIRAGRGRLTLMRVLLEGAGPRATIQLTGPQLLLPTEATGGGRYRQIRNGDFILVDHSSSSQRKDNKDPVEIGSFTHHRAMVWLDVPTPGVPGILGDVVLLPVRAEQMGRIVALPFADTRLPINVRQLRIGPVVVGGEFGESLPLRLNQPSDTGKIAPGSYKLQLPDFDQQNSRWTVEVLPGKVTQLRFVTHSQREIEKTEELHIPEVERMGRGSTRRNQ